MKNLLTYLLSFLGLATACGQQNYKDADVEGFAKLAADENVVVLDVRTAGEFGEGHLDGALNIAVLQEDFLQKAKDTLPVGKTIAVYCRSGRRSANACKKLAAEGFRVVNLKGGIVAWMGAKMPTTTAATYEMDVFKTKSGKTIKFYALMHASIRMVYDGVEIEIDPVTKLGNRTVDYTAMPKADYIFVTHEHGDHYDPEAIEQLSGDNTRLVTNKRCADMLGRGEVMGNGDKMELADAFTVEAVQAYNITPDHLQFHPKGRDNGYVFTIDGLRIYVAGDTEDIPEMGTLTGIDIAFLPCNQPYTMTTGQLLRAARIIRPRVLFPYHYGQTDVSGIPAQLADDEIDVRIRRYE